MKRQDAKLEWKVIDRWAVVNQTSGISSDEHFQSQMSALMAHNLVGMLFVPIGLPTLSPLQRKQLIDLFKTHRVRCAIFANSTLVLGVATALGWFYEWVKPFKKLDRASIAAYLQIPTEIQERFFAQTQSYHARTPLEENARG